MEANPARGFNAFRIKRQAHRISRGREALSALDQWNTFRHIWTDNHQHRDEHAWDFDSEGAPVPSTGHEVHQMGSLRRAARLEDPDPTRPDLDAGDDKKPNKESNFNTAKPLEPFTVGNQIQRTLFGAWINVLLLAVPAGIIIDYLHVSTVASFVINFVAIFPLYFMTSFAMTEIEMRLGSYLSGFLSISAR